MATEIDDHVGVFALHHNNLHSDPPNPGRDVVSVCSLKVSPLFAVGANIALIGGLSFPTCPVD
jgi:hypothetical protein